MPADKITAYLIDPVTLEALPAKFEALAVTDDAPAAGDFVRVFEQFLRAHPNFGTEFPDAAAIYTKYLNQARFIGLSHLPARDIRVLFGQYFSAIFAIPEYNVIERVRSLLRGKPYEARDPFRKEISDALIEGKGEITRTKITTKVGEEPGTAANWIKDYVREAGTTGRDAIKRAQYLTGGANIKRLAPEERERVKTLVELFDFLQISSISPEGFEDTTYEDTEKGVRYYEGGAPIEVDDAIIKRAQEILGARRKVSDDAILAIYKGPAEESEAIAKATEEIQKKTKDPKAWERMLLDAAMPPAPMGKPADTPRVVALLRLLVSSGQLEKALRANPAFQNLVIERYQRLARPAEIDGFKLQPILPPHLATFFRAIFEDRLKLSETESARFGAQIANLLRAQRRPELLERVYFDEASRTFRWVA